MTAKETSEETSSCYKLRDYSRGLLMLDVRLVNGDRYALPYSYLIWAKLGGGEEIFIRFSSHTVLIKGRNLLAIYGGLLQHRVEFVQEEDPRHDIGPESEPFISTISVFEPKEAGQ